MCLETIVEKFTIGSKEFKAKGFGWKVFRKYRVEDKVSVLDGVFRCFPRRIIKGDTGKWLDEKRFRNVLVGDFLTSSADGHLECYRTGWHFYATRREALRKRATGISEVIRKVYYKGLVAKGIQGGCRVLVAKKIKLEKV